MAPRLSDLTAYRLALDADQRALELRQAAIAIAVIRDQLGPMAADDPALLEMWLRTRRISESQQLAIKAAVAAIDSTSGLAPTRPMLGAFLAAVDHRSILGALGAIKVPSTNVVGAAATASVSSFWIGETTAKPLGAMAFASLALTPRKLAAQVAISRELVKLASADVLTLIERAVVSAVASELDSALLDPSNAGTENVKPPSLTNGLVAIVAAGDFQNQVGQVFNAISDGAPSRPVLICSLQSALRLAALDVAQAGIKVVISPAAGANLIAVDADGIVYTDDGGDLKVGEPTIEMADNPATPTVAGTVLVSLFQRDLKAVRGERFINWAKRSDAVAHLTLA